MSVSALVVIALCLDIDTSNTLLVMVKASPAVSPEPLLPINVEYNIFFVFPLASSNIY